MNEIKKLEEKLENAKTNDIIEFMGKKIKVFK